MIRIPLVLALSLASVAQALPDAPSAHVAPTRQCGPKWLGGCWNGHDVATWHETFHDRKWQISTIALIGATAYDYALTARYVNEPCVERNEALGRDPGAGDFAKEFVTTHLPVIVLGTVIHRIGLRNRYASWIYPGMMAYGVQMHVRDGTGWFTCH